MANSISRPWINKLGINKLWQDQRGQDMTEYALIGGMMASMVVAVVPPMMSVAMHIVELLQQVAQVAMTAAGLA
jgi:Flp pilus assembly pilin Flp